MSKSLFLSSYNENKTLRAIFEENNDNAWLYLCTVQKDKKHNSDVRGDVFICNTVELIEHHELERYKPNLPPITKSFGTPEAFCNDINSIEWGLEWLSNTSIQLKKDNTPWAIISLDNKRGMCKSIKKNGPWGEAWNEEKFQNLVNLK